MSWPRPQSGSSSEVCFIRVHADLVVRRLSDSDSELCLRPSLTLLNLLAQAARTSNEQAQALRIVH